MKKLTAYLARKYALRAFREAAVTDPSEVGPAILDLTRWIACLKGVTEYLEKLVARLSDKGPLTDTEADEAIAGSVQLAYEIGDELAG